VPANNSKARYKRLRKGAFSRFNGIAGSVFAGDALVLGVQFLIGLFVLGVFGNTIDRANFYALRSLVMADTLGAQIGIDLINLVTLGNGAVGALGFTNIAIDAFIGND
jgi:hypothetical protein